jgi:hypothetical protein
MLNTTSHFTFVKQDIDFHTNLSVILPTVIIVINFGDNLQFLQTKTDRPIREKWSS